MHRSGSTNRVSDDYLKYNSSPPSSNASAVQRALSLEADELPLFEPPPEMSKKEKPHAKFAENAVHLIPLVLLLCALVLWLFSNPEVYLATKGDSVAATIEGLKLEEGELDTDSAQTGVLAGIELGDLDQTAKQQYKFHRAAFTSDNKSS